MIHLFIINPAAGSRDQTEEYRQRITAGCEARKLQYHIEVSKAPGDCRKIARKAAETGEDLRIYACGGDGTLNEVVSGAAGFPNVAVTHFAGGSGNDFVRIFSDTQPFHEIDRLLDDPEETEFDMIRCNDSLALNVCSVGFDARIGTDIARYKRFPLLHGFRAYVASAVVNVIRGVTDHYKVEVDGDTYDGKFTMVCVCNGRYYGGGFNPIPESDPCDGKLDVLVVGPVFRLMVVKVIGKYKDGRYSEMPQLVKHYRTDAVKITCPHVIGINLDGELQHSDTINIRVADEKIRFFYPKGLSYEAKPRK